MAVTESDPDLISPIFRYDSPKKCPTILYAVNLWLKPVSATGARKGGAYDTFKRFEIIAVLKVIIIVLHMCSVVSDHLITQERRTMNLKLVIMVVFSDGIPATVETVETLIQEKGHQFW